MEGKKIDPEESKGLNPNASDFTPKSQPEELKHDLKADADSFEPSTIISVESYETHSISHVKSADKFLGRYGLLNFILFDNFTTYDAIEDTWTTYSEWTVKSKGPEAKYSRSLLTSPNSFIISGGLNEEALKHSYHADISLSFGTTTNTLEVYEMQEARYLHGMALFNSKVYAIGGQNSSSSYLRSVEAFENGCWTLKAPLNRPRSSFTVIVNNSAIWVAGGFSGAGEVCQSLEKFEGGEWALIEVTVPMLAGMTAVPRDKFNSSFYVVGGSDGNEMSKRVLVFNTENSRFDEDQQELLHPRAGAAACCDGNTFWLVGGGQLIGECWNGQRKTETKTMPLSVYAQIESASFVKSRE